MAKLSQFDTVTNSNAGIELELKLVKTGAPSGAFISVLGRDSDEYRAIRSERQRMFSERITTGKTDDLTEEEKDDLACDLLARCTKGWRGIEGDDGPLLFSMAAAKKLYADYPAIREQVNIFIGDRANFVRA